MTNMQYALHLQKLQSWWKSLSRRDRGLLMVWLSGMLMAAVVGIGSALASAHTRANLQLAAELKVLQKMRLRADELLQLKQLPTAASSVKVVSTFAVKSTLSKYELPDNVLQGMESPDQIGVQGVVPFDKWVAWVAFVQKDMHLIVRQAKIKPTEQPGWVEIQAMLELDKG